MIGTSTSSAPLFIDSDERGRWGWFRHGYAEAWGRQWQAFLGRERMAAAPAELAVVVSDLAGFLLPLIGPAVRDERWKSGEGWRASDAG